MAYQTITVDLTSAPFGTPEAPGAPDLLLNEMAEAGWRVHTVQEATATTFKALMERFPNTPSPSRVQPPRQAVRPD